MEHTSITPNTGRKNTNNAYEVEIILQIFQILFSNIVDNNNNNKLAIMVIVFLTCIFHYIYIISII